MSEAAQCELEGAMRGAGSRLGQLGVAAELECLRMPAKPRGALSNNAPAPIFPIFPVPYEQIAAMPP